jgi:hypothetical protein
MAGEGVVASSMSPPPNLYQMSTRYYQPFALPGKSPLLVCSAKLHNDTHILNDLYRPIFF